MIDLRIALLTAVASLSVGVPAQAEKQEPKPAAPQEAAPVLKEVGKLIQDLGSESYRTRLDAERALRQMGKDALPALEKAAAEAEDAEVQWRARRLLRQLGKGGGDLVQRDRGGKEPAVGDPQQPQQDRRQPFPWWRGGAWDTDAIRDQFESLFEQFERDLGLDIPRARFFQDDFFQDLQNQIGKANVRSQGMSMQIGPDGSVKVEVKEQGEDGKVETKTYEAPDLETFQKNHPGVLGRNGLGMGLSPFWSRSGSPLRGFTFGWPGRGLPLTPVPNESNEPNEWGDVQLEELAPAPVAPPAGKRLGISIQPQIAPQVREYLGLAEGVGLQVEAVSEGSLAAALGLERGDIVTKVAGKTVGSPQDVQDALGAIEKGAEVEVHFVRKGVEKTAKANKHEAVEAPKPDGEGAKKSKLEKRHKGESSIR